MPSNVASMVPHHVLYAIGWRYSHAKCRHYDSKLRLLRLSKLVLTATGWNACNRRTNRACQFDGGRTSEMQRL